jgi:hypothetical protein
MRPPRLQEFDEPAGQLDPDYTAAYFMAAQTLATARTHRRRRLSV